VEKVALISLPASVAEANPYLQDQGFYVDPARKVVILKVTYQQHKYNPYNILEDRALSVLKQELIHPFLGERDASQNILKDTKRFLKDLTDIVRGEYIGSISYQRTDFVTSTKTHEDRLRFLSAWLSKNQRRLATYSAESFEAMKKLLNSYLLNRDYREPFGKHTDLHREVLQRIAYLTQAHWLQALERLAQGDVGRRRLRADRRLAQAVNFLEEKKDELPYFYPDLFDKCLDLWHQILASAYYKELRASETPPASPFRYRVWQNLEKGQQLMAEIREHYHQVQAEVKRGTPFPVLLPETPGALAPPRP
jgi:hypothetical protein